jgi:hypothetical protein
MPASKPTGGTAIKQPATRYATTEGCESKA